MLLTLNCPLFLFNYAFDVKLSSSFTFTTYLLLKLSSIFIMLLLLVRPLFFLYMCYIKRFLTVFLKRQTGISMLVRLISF